MIYSNTNDSRRHEEIILEQKKRNNAMEKEIEDLRRKSEETDRLVGEISQRLKNLDVSSRSHCQPDKFFEEGYRDRSLVFSGLARPELHPFNFPNKHEWVHALNTEVYNILGSLNIPYVPCDVFPMGNFLVKVRFGTRAACKLVLESAQRLRFSSEWQKVHIRPSLSEEQRAERAANHKRAEAERTFRESKGERVYIRALANFVEFEVCTAQTRARSEIPHWHQNQHTQN